MTDADFRAVLLELDILEHTAVTAEIKALIEKTKELVSSIMASTDLTLERKQLRLQLARNSSKFLQDSDVRLATIQIDTLINL